MRLLMMFVQALMLRLLQMLLKPVRSVLLLQV